MDAITAAFIEQQYRSCALVASAAERRLAEYDGTAVPMSANDADVAALGHRSGPLRLTTGGLGRRRRRAMTARFAALALGGAVLAAACGGAPTSGLGAARHVASDDVRFEASLDAAQAFSDVADHLVEAGNECAEERSKDDPVCADRYSLAAWAKLSAPRLVGCTLPTVVEARIVLLDRLGTLAAGDRVTIPPVPAC